MVYARVDRDCGGQFCGRCADGVAEDEAGGAICGDVADVLGAAFEALSDKQKREYGVSCGIEVTGVLNGELKNAGIKKGFIITVVNDQKIYSPEQLEKLVENVLRGSVDEQYLVIKGFYPNGRSRVFAIELND